MALHVDISPGMSYCLYMKHLEKKAEYKKVQKDLTNGEQQKLRAQERNKRNCLLYCCSLHLRWEMSLLSILRWPCMINNSLTTFISKRNPYKINIFDSTAVSFSSLMMRTVHTMWSQRYQSTWFSRKNKESQSSAEAVTHKDARFFPWSEVSQGFSLSLAVVKAINMFLWGNSWPDLRPKHCCLAIFSGLMTLPLMLKKYSCHLSSSMPLP